MPRSLGRPTPSQSRVATVPLLGFAAAAASLLLPGSARAETITVTPPGSPGGVIDDVVRAGDGRCSLGEAIIAANDDAPFNECPGGLFTDDIVLPEATIRFTTPHRVTGNYGIHLWGQGTTKTVLDGGAQLMTGFNVGSGSDGPQFVATNLTFMRFNVHALYFLPGSWGNLGGILFENNKLDTREGGAIYFNGTNLFISSSTFRNNGGTRSVANGIVAGVPRGGAIATTSTTAVVISNSTFEGNNAGQNGGAILSRGSLELYNVTLSDNAAEFGGGGLTVASGSALITNSTIHRNKQVSSSTSSGGGGGIHVYSGTAQVQNSIIAGNTVGAGRAGPDCAGTLTSSGYNLVGNTSGCDFVSGTGDQLNVDPKLEPLALWGGPVAAHKPATGSPAIDRGSPESGTVTACQLKDYRGVRRNADGDKVDGGRCDVGAMEVGAVLLVASSSSLSSGDVSIRNRFEQQLGFVVFPGDDDAMTAANTSGKNMVLLSESGSSGTMTSRFRDVTIPVMVLEPGVYDDMLMTGAAADDFGSTSNTTSLAMVDAHMMAAGLKGTVTTTSSAQTYGFGRALAPGAKCVARASSTSTRCMIFRIGKDEWLMNNVRAPARRVGFFASRSAAAALTDAGWKLFDASVIWAAGGASN